MFEKLSAKDSFLIALVKRAFLLVLGIYVVIGMMAGYRAWYQVKSLEVKVSDLTLRPGSVVDATLVSYARTNVDVRLELIQGPHAETLAVQFVPGNEWAFFDPRIRRASQSALLTEEVMSRFETGEARLRATAIGRHQWMRLPPPVVRELAVEIKEY